MIDEIMLNELKKLDEIDAYSYDGSYKLLSEIVDSYSRITDYSVCDYKDLNAIYLMAIGTWKINVEKKKEYVNNSHLTEEEKQRLCDVLDDVWDQACRKVFKHNNGDKPTIGMFGTGFYSFEKNISGYDAQRVIMMLVDIEGMSSDDEMFDRVESVFNSNVKGMGAASASVILHCLKPYTFPILNSNAGNGTIYERLGLPVSRTGSVEAYIANCKIIKKFRDEYLPYKNYRVLDIAAWNEDDSTWKPSLSEYDPKITKEQWYELISDDTIIGSIWGKILAMFYSVKEGVSCSYLARKYGYDPSSISGSVTQMLIAISKRTGCPIYQGDSKTQYWPIMFRYRAAKNGELGSYIWRLRPELVEALDQSDITKYLTEDKKMYTDKNISKNTILYGPPGTGKTYNTVLYAVSIIEGKSIVDVQNEALSDYTEVKRRYDSYISNGRIAFTTFHQSYGYEEFIEGIKPTMRDGENDISYAVEDGVFKAFCDKASAPSLNGMSELGVNSDPAVWKVSLGGSHENAVRTECLSNDHIRIGWDKYGPDVSDRINELDNGKMVLNAFYNVMRIGDIVLSCYSAKEIDAIGVIVGDPEWNETYGEYRRVRKVKWIVKNIREDIVDYQGYPMAPATVYWMGLTYNDIVSMLNKHMPHEVAKNNEKYVFVIDEINRGNISKIFGELITLIEASKRIGSSEEMKAKLPYSHSYFGVPDNVYILGTMNTADRSIAIMDTALRRRFSFVEMLPDTDILRRLGVDKVIDNGVELDVAAMLDVINKRIEFLYDREHTIGHSFFIPLKDDPTVDGLAKIFKNSIIPLLQEYFYEDYSKIQLILGDDGKRVPDRKKYQFIRDEEVNVNSLFRSNPDMDSETKYTIQESAFYDINSYKLIDAGL